MKAGPDDRPLGYYQYDWGDGVEGTKAQLQALGLGTGLAFPGEPGGPRRQLWTRDPRGYEVSISQGLSDGLYWASITFPGWPMSPCFEEKWEHFAPGVRLHKLCHSDVFVGSAEALVAAGIVRGEHLPGQPGMRKTCVRILPDGTVFAGATTASHYGFYQPGARRIRKASGSRFCVYVRVSREEEAHRNAIKRAAVAEWERTVRALPRPPRLDAPTPAAPPPRTRDHLRLVWSAPIRGAA